MRNCPTCGAPVRVKAPPTGSADWLLDILTNSIPHREVYHGQRGGWWLTYGGGEVSPEAVHELVARGAIVSVYSNCPNGSYHVGRTLDIDRTMEARKKFGKGAPEYYLEQTSGA